MAPNGCREPCKIKQAFNQHCWHIQNSLANVSWGQTHGKEGLYLVRLSLLVEHACINSSSDQVVGCSDGMDVTSEVKVKLEDMEHISYLILLQFSFIPTHRRQMEREVLIVMLKWVRVEGERLLSAVCGREERISLKHKNASPTLMSFYKLLKQSSQIKSCLFFSFSPPPEQLSQAPWYLEDPTQNTLCSALLLLHPPTDPLVCTAGFTHTLTEVAAAPTRESELNWN